MSNPLLEYEVTLAILQCAACAAIVSGTYELPVSLLCERHANVSPAELKRLSGSFTQNELELNLARKQSR